MKLWNTETLKNYMRIKYQLAPGFEHLENWIRELPEYFANNGQSIFKSRNEVKIFDVEKFQLNVKAFKVPNLINRFAYVYIRGSKAERSYNYASKFFSLGIPTPRAIGFVECLSNGLLRNSYFISLHCNYDFTLREVLNYQVSGRDEILCQWIGFTFLKLHQNNIFHRDYSPGNVLINKVDNKYEFNIIDLNRMKFKYIDFNTGLKNFRQLDTDHDTLQLLASEYARLRGQDKMKASNRLFKYDRKNKLSRHGRGKIKRAVKLIFRSGHDV